MFMFQYTLQRLYEILFAGLVESLDTDRAEWRAFGSGETPDAILTIWFKVVEAGHYDYAVDGVGMEVGEGWIPAGYNEVVATKTTVEREGYQLVLNDEAQSLSPYADNTSEWVWQPVCTGGVMHTRACKVCGITEEQICGGCGTYECFDTWACSEQYS